MQHSPCPASGTLWLCFLLRVKFVCHRMHMQSHAALTLSCLTSSLLWKSVSSNAHEESCSAHPVLPCKLCSCAYSGLTTLLWKLVSPNAHAESCSAHPVLPHELCGCAYSCLTLLYYGKRCHHMHMQSHADSISTHPVLPHELCGCAYSWLCNFVSSYAHAESCSTHPALLHKLFIMKICVIECTWRVMQRSPCSALQAL